VIDLQSLVFLGGIISTSKISIISASNQNVFGFWEDDYCITPWNKKCLSIHQMTCTLSTVTASGVVTAPICEL